MKGMKGNKSKHLVSGEKADPLSLVKDRVMR